MRRTYQASAIAVVILSLALSTSIPGLLWEALHDMRYTGTLGPYLTHLLSPHKLRSRSIASSRVPRVYCQLTSPFIRMASLAPAKSFADAVKDRRTYYAVSNESTIPDSRIQEIVKDAILNTPSAFNSQTSRAVVLLGDEHVKMWDITIEVYKQQLPEEKFNRANQRFQGFRAGYGTVRRRQISCRKGTCC